jgi:hypothetical protein
MPFERGLRRILSNRKSRRLDARPVRCCKVRSQPLPLPMLKLRLTLFRKRLHALFLVGQRES